MKKTLLILITICFTSYCCSVKNSLDEKSDLSVYGLNGKVKSIKSQIYELVRLKDTFKIGSKLNSLGFDKNAHLVFNNSGDLKNEKEFRADGKIVKEIVYEYDKDYKLIHEKEIDFNGHINSEIEYIYDSGDSLSQWNNSENDLLIIHKIKRDDLDRPIEMKILHKDTIVRLLKVEYGNNDKIISEIVFETEIDTFKTTNRTYNKKGFKKEEKIVQYNTWDTIKYTNSFFYDTDDNLTLAKYDIYDDSTYTEIKYTYVENGKLKRTVRKPIGGSYHVIIDQKYNDKGDLIEYSRTPSDGKSKQIWTSQYKYDNLNNWTEKISFKDGKPLSLIKREISYYE